jgi:hypothetical protein
MELTEKQYETANRRGTAAKSAFPPAVAVRYDEALDQIIVSLSSGLELRFSPRKAQGLQDASSEALADAQITPSGLGIHFPQLDADLYLPALMEGFLGTKRWMAAQLGKIGGSSSSDAKVSAARKNGKLGGRPRKSTVKKVA